MLVPAIPPRDPDSHKGTFGRAMIVAGSRGMAGAASLATYAAVRSGAGLVRAAVPSGILNTVAAFDPCYMTIPLPDSDGMVSENAFEAFASWMASTSSIGVGPGLGQSDGVTSLVSNIYKGFNGPLVVDADAINAIAKTPEVLGHAAGPRIFTPHIGEFRRLIGEPDLSPGECRRRVSEFARVNNIVVLLKASRTLVTDGSHHYENTTGNPGMDTGGSGDVLTGVLTALCGQSYSPFEAAVLGSYIHGLAGDLAVEECGEVSLTALDVAEFLGAAFSQHAESG